MGPFTRIAALYDIHGNLPALEAVLHDIRAATVDAIVVGGDVLPGPMPRETIECLRSLDIPMLCIHGNGEREVLARVRGEETDTIPERFREMMRWTARQLESNDVALLASWPLTLRIAVRGIGEVLFCHATPRNDTEIFTRLTPEDRLNPIFAGVDVPLVVCGHTHMQFDRSVGRIRVVNAGSVGMPFEEPGAYWLLVGPHVQLRHTQYDLEEAAARMRRTGYPLADDFAANNVLRPPSAAATLQAFAQLEVR